MSSHEPANNVSWQSDMNAETESYSTKRHTGWSDTNANTTQQCTSRLDTNVNIANYITPLTHVMLITCDPLCTTQQGFDAASDTWGVKHLCGRVIHEVKSPTAVMFYTSTHERPFVQWKCFRPFLLMVWNLFLATSTVVGEGRGFGLLIVKINWT